MTETERLIKAISDYTKDAPAHSALSTVHMLVIELHEAYRKEHQAVLLGEPVEQVVEQ